MHRFEQERDKTKKNERSQKSFCDYNWHELKKNGKLDSLTKSELQHDLKNFKLSCQGKKSDWIERITTHLTLHGNLYSNQSTAPMTFSINISNTSSIANFENDFSTDADSDSDEDEVLAVGSGSDEDYLEDQDQDFYISYNNTVW